MNPLFFPSKLFVNQVNFSEGPILDHDSLLVSCTVLDVIKKVVI